MGNVVNRFAFHPPEPATYTQELLGLVFINSTTLTASKELTEVDDIPAVFHERPPNRLGKPYTILFSHGNAEDIGGDLQKWLIYLATYLDVNVISFEYSGFGLNKQKLPSEQSCYDNILTVWNYLTKTKGIPPHCVILMGRSIGSGPSVHLAASLSSKAKRAVKRVEWLKRELELPKYRTDWYHFKRLKYQKELAELEITAKDTPAAVVLQSPIASCIRIVSNALAFLPIDLFTNVKKMRKIRCPILIVHGTDDQVVPFRHSTLLWQSCNTHRWRFVPILQAGHNNIESYQLFRDQLLASMLDLLTVIRDPQEERPPLLEKEENHNDNSRSSNRLRIEISQHKIREVSSANGSSVSPCLALRMNNDNISDDMSRFLIRTKMIEVDDDIEDVVIADGELSLSNHRQIVADNLDHLILENDSVSSVDESEESENDEDQKFITGQPHPLLPSCLFYSKLKIGLRSQVQLDAFEEEPEKPLKSEKSQLTLKKSQHELHRLKPKHVAFAGDSSDEDEYTRDYDETVDPDEALGRNLFKFNSEFEFSSDEDDEDD